MIPDLDATERNGKLILVAEDQPADRAVVSMQLNFLGYASLIVNDGREAFREWQNRRFELVITDCHMPVMDGFELAELIRTEERDSPASSRTPIVAITEKALSGEMDLWQAAGMDEILYKPLDLEKLKLTIDTCMESRHRKQSVPIEPAEDRQIIDFDRLGEFVGSNDKEVHKPLLTIYWRTAVEDFILINNAIIRKNSGELRDRIHSAKGATHFAGALRLGKFFDRLHIEAKNDEWDKLFKSIQNYGAELRGIERLLISRKIISPNS